MITPEQISMETSIENSMKENPSLIQSLNNDQSLLDTSNNVEANTFVSKSYDEDERNVQKIGEETHLPSVGSNSSAKSESVIKEKSTVDEQQNHENQVEINGTIEEKK